MLGTSWKIARNKVNKMRSDRYKNIVPWYKQFWGWVIIAAFVIGIVGIGITALLDGVSSSKPTNSSSNVTNSTDVSKAQGSFNGRIAKLPKYTIKIKDVSLVENNDGDKCIAFNYTVYNKSAKNISASEAWMQTFTVYQPNKNTQNQLDEEVDIDDSISDEMNQEINKGGHARGQYIAILKSNKHPVVLKASDGDGQLIGKHTYKIKAKASSKNKKAAPADSKKQVASSSTTTTTKATNANDASSNSSKNDNKDDDKVIIDGHSFHHQNFNDGDNNYDMLVGDNGEGELTEWAVNSPTGQQDPDMQSKVNAIYGH